MSNQSGSTVQSQNRLAWHKRLAVIMLGSILFLAACSSADESDSVDATSFDQASSEDSASAVEANAAASQESAQDATDGVSDPEVVRAPSQTGRLIRRDASVTLEVENLSVAIKEVGETVVAGDAYLAAEETDERSSYLTFKVPSDDFDRVLEDLPEIGKLRSQQVSSDDRTDVIVDLRSQLETAEKSLERTRGFFEQATTVEDLTRVEAEVAQREAAVASIKAQLQNEERSVALSTVNVSLFLADDQPVELDEDPDAGLVDAFSNGFSALTSVLFAFFVVIAWLLPWIPVIAAVVYGVRWLLRRAAQKRKERPQRPTPQLHPNQHPNQPMPQQMGAPNYPTAAAPRPTQQPEAVAGSQTPQETAAENSDEE